VIFHGDRDTAYEHGSHERIPRQPFGQFRWQGMDDNACRGEGTAARNGRASLSATKLLQNVTDAFITGASSLEPGRICMITSYSQIASSRPKLMVDACFAL